MIRKIKTFCDLSETSLRQGLKEFQLAFISYPKILIYNENDYSTKEIGTIVMKISPNRSLAFLSLPLPEDSWMLISEKGILFSPGA